ncbi:MAG: SPOR domain-containing protein [Mucilaginibacter sp.]
MKNTSVYKALFCCIAGCVFFMPIFAQERGKVEVIKDPRIDTLIAKRFSFKDNAAASAPFSSNGYRVQLYSGSDRKAAYSAQAKFQEKYPEIHTYITYIQPNFKVRAGNFRTRLGAEKMTQQLKGLFFGLFIIPEKIDPTKADQSND